MQTLSFDTYPCYFYGVNLDNSNYYFKLTWNDRVEFWTLEIQDETQTPIVSGIKLVLNYDLIQDYKHLPVPLGGLMVVDFSGDESKIQYEDFQNKRVLQFVYIEVSDLVAS